MHAWIRAALPRMNSAVRAGALPVLRTGLAAIQARCYAPRRDGRADERSPTRTRSRWRDRRRATTFSRVISRKPSVMVLFALGFASTSGCGPELGPVTPHVVSGYYRAASIESDDSCEMNVVWSTEVSAGYSRDDFEALFADAVPIRADVDHLEVP